MTTLEIILAVLAVVLGLSTCWYSSSARSSELLANEHHASLLALRRKYKELQDRPAAREKELAVLREAASISWDLLHLGNPPDKTVHSRYGGLSEAIQQRQERRLQMLRTWNLQLNPLPLCPYLECRK